MRNIKLTLCYDGTDFHGWQRQPGLRTIQQTLEDAILELTQARPTTTASSRTDAGVHALGQVVHFLTASRHRPEIIREGPQCALAPRPPRARGSENAPGLSCNPRRQVEAVPLCDRQCGRSPARFSCGIAGTCSAASTSRRWTVPAPHSLGRHDFRSFETEWPNRTSSVRTILDLIVDPER